MMKDTLALLALLLALLGSGSYAYAAAGDVELDPIAYVLDGHSMHVGLRLDHQRFDLGNFAAAVPEAFHGNSGFSVYMSGLGVKYDLCLKADCNGGFAGLDASLVRSWITLDSTDETAQRRQLGVGVRVGYRFSFSADGKGLYVVPWVSVSYNWFSDDVVLGGKKLDDRRIGIFPTVHVGWAF